MKSKAKTHNTADCYDKPGNEGKKPAPKSSTSTPSTSGSGNNGNKGTQAKPYKAYKARLLEFIQELEEDGPASPAGTVNVNTASIEEIHDPEPAEQGATASVDEVQMGPSKPMGKSKKVNRWAHLGFPKGL